MSQTTPCPHEVPRNAKHCALCSSKLGGEELRVGRLRRVPCREVAGGNTAAAAGHVMDLCDHVGPEDLPADSVVSPAAQLVERGTCRGCGRAMERPCPGPLGGCANVRGRLEYLRVARAVRGQPLPSAALPRATFVDTTQGEPASAAPEIDPVEEVRRLATPRYAPRSRSYLHLTLGMALALGGAPPSLPISNSDPRRRPR